MKILVVEDEEILSEVLKEKFKREGYEVMVAVDGDEIISKTKKFMPDMVLLDLLLPKKDGLTILKELKDDPALKNIPVIIFSGLSDDENIKKGIQLGALDYFVKTQHPLAQIIDKVNAYLKK